MINVERRLKILHTKYIKLSDLAEDKRKRADQLARMFLVGGFVSKGSRQEYNTARVAAQDKGTQIVDTLAARIGLYPLNECSYTQIHPLLGSGFSYGFDYTLGETLFEVPFHSQGRLGIFAQRHEDTFEPQIEIRRAHPHEVLHLPEGFIIPAGPFYFEEESMPMDEKTQREREETAEKMLGALNENQGNMLLAGGLSRYLEETRVTPARYFNWMPTLPDTPAYIIFDVENHHPKYWGLTPETAPTYTETVKGLLEGFLQFPSNMEFVAKNCTRCKLLK